MDISSTIIANSDQVNASDLIGRPVTVTITDVTGGDADQPVHIKTKELGKKTFRPGKNMRRVLGKLWGNEASKWVGGRLTLYNDPNVMWAGQPVGGVRISHASGISTPVKVPLQVARGKFDQFTVQPLTEPASTPTDSITENTWAEINSLATEKGVDNVPDWIGEQLGRKLQGWREISEAEGDALLKTLTTGEVK